MWFSLVILLIGFDIIRALNFVPLNRTNKTLQVTTLNGIIQGSEKQQLNGEVYFSFEGIPFAEPPINELRFTGPKKVANWSGVLDAAEKSPCCASLDLHNSNQFKFQLMGDEDCLYLSVYTPKHPVEREKEKPLAVMVFFHGGAFIGDCANLYGPDYLIKNDVILVIPSYRLSIFGFLSTEDLECPGNWASKDNIAALKWVQSNIHRFGGNPKRVTIFGHSAGAALVNVLLVTPKAAGLFHRAILMSGSTLSFWAYQVKQRKIAFDVGRLLGIRTDNSKVLIESLRKVGSRALAGAQIPIMRQSWKRVLSEGLPFTIAVEPFHNQALLTNFTYDTLKTGRFNRVPVMTGVTSLEALIFRPMVTLLRLFLDGLFNADPAYFARMTDNSTARAIVGHKLNKHFFQRSKFVLPTILQLLEFFSDDAFKRPVQKMASLIAKYVPVYFYQFSYQGPAGTQFISRYNGQDPTRRRENGVAHGEDLAYLFSFEELTLNDKDIKLMEKLTQVYTNFAKFGNPTPVANSSLNNAKWATISSNKFPYMDINSNFTQHSDSFDAINFSFWNYLFTTYGQQPYKVY